MKHAQGIERREIMGDWFDEIAYEMEREEANRERPEDEPLTEEELDEFSIQWSDAQEKMG